MEHKGQQYFFTVNEPDLHIGEKREILIITSDNYNPHLIFAVDIKGSIRFRLYEDTEVSANGSELNIVNYNRNNLTPPLTKFYNNPTITDDGTKIIDKKIYTECNCCPILHRFEDSIDREFILKRNTQYLLRVTSEIDDNVVQLCVELFEEYD